MHTLDEAQALILDGVRPLDGEAVDLWAAHGRVLAAPLIAARDLPGFDDAAMDGFAVRAGDGAGPRPIVGEVRAGARDVAALLPGAAMRITTGAPLPPGADAVVMREDAVEAGATVTLPATEVGANVRRRGSDLVTGALALTAGAALGPGELGLLAALGVARPVVVRRPRVAILATGDELVDVGTPAGPGQRVDSSAHTLLAACVEAGAAPTYLGVAPDEPAALTDRLRAALDADVLLTTGGVSVGGHDHVKAALAAVGATLELWKVAMRPGKPIAFARAGATACFGLPGNPVSTWVAFELFVRPYLRALAGHAAPHRPRVPVRLTAPYRKPVGRTHLVRATVRRDGDTLYATPLANQSSGALTSMRQVDALVEIDAAATALDAGAPTYAWLLRAC